MTERTYRALLIANSTFPADPHNLPELEGPRSDAAILRSALCDDAVGLFPSDNIRLVTERTMSEIMKEVDGFLRRATGRDTLLLYYSGHGILDQKNELYWCARDTVSDALRSTGVSASWVAGSIESSAAGATVILLDCCHSGAFKGGDVSSLAGTGRFVVSSVRASELSIDTGKQNQASLFTAALVEGLQRGVQDLDRDGVVTLDDLYHFVHHKLSTTSKLVPHQSFSGTGDIPIARRARVDGPELPAGVVDPKDDPPVLDVSDTQLDLGDVRLGDKLSPERITVLNRGGGQLDWTAECGQAWVTLERDGSRLTLRLRPPLGSNHADVVIRDAASGMTKTVGVTVRVSERAPRVGWRWIAAIGGVVALVALIVVFVFTRPSDDPGRDPTTTAATTATTGATGAVESAVLASGAKLQAGEKLESTNGRHTLEMSSEGYLVARTDGNEWWRQPNAGPPEVRLGLWRYPGSYAYMQPDGNFVVYPTGPGEAVWATNTRNPGAHLEITDKDGLGVIGVYASDGKPLWEEVESDLTLQATGPPSTSPTPTDSEPQRVTIEPEQQAIE